MSHDANSTVKAVQDSLANLLNLVKQAARERSAEESMALQEEARTIILMMVAAIVLADEKYAEGERAFVNLLADANEKPGDDMHYLKESAGRWRAASTQVPRFFQVGADHDRRSHTEVAREMLREIQFIGDSACVCDGHFEAVEHEVVKNFAAILDSFLVRMARPGATDNKATEGWTSI